jgi:intracellular septation protein A
MPTSLGARLAVAVVAPAVAYGVIRPLVGSDSAALATAGAIPLIYNVVLAFWRRRIDRLSVLSTVGLAVGCLLSVLLGGNALPLKLKLASVTFLVGLVLLVAVLVRRPIPLTRVFRVASSNRMDAVLGAVIGGFLMLHAMLHLALAVLLSTQAYVIASPIVDWGTLGVGFIALRAFVRHLPPEIRSNPDDGRPSAEVGRSPA